MSSWLAFFENGTLPSVVAAVVGYAAWRGVPVYDTFIEGAKEGFDTAIRVLPYLVAVFVVVGMCRASGLLDAFAGATGGALTAIGISPELLPMILVRPLSGSGADGVMVELLKTHGPNSQVGITSAVMSGASDTTFYVLAVYFGAVAVKRTRHAIAAGLIGDITGMVAAAWITSLLLF